jgi:hypothetical protein
MRSLPDCAAERHHGYMSAVGMALAAGIFGSGRGDHAGAAAAGWQVMAALLEAVAGPLAGEDQGVALVSGMRLVAIGGMCLDLPATPENGAEFGYPGSESGPGPFPQIRVLGIGECGTRAVLGAATSPLATGEQALARQLLAKLAPGDLLAADRNFLSHGLLKEVLEAGVHVLWRAKSDVDLPVLEVLPDGTWLSRIAGPAASRRMRRKGASAASAALAAFPLTALTTLSPTWHSRSPAHATSSPNAPAAVTPAKPNVQAGGTRPASTASPPG